MTSIDQLRDHLKRDPEPEPEPNKPIIGKNWSPASIAVLGAKQMCAYKFCFNVARYESDDDNTCACPEHANDECWPSQQPIIWGAIKADMVGKVYCDILDCQKEACWSATLKDYLKRWSCQEHAKNELHTEWRMPTKRPGE